MHELCHHSGWDDGCDRLGHNDSFHDVIDQTMARLHEWPQMHDAKCVSSTTIRPVGVSLCQATLTLVTLLSSFVHFHKNGGEGASSLPLQEREMQQMPKVQILQVRMQWPSSRAGLQ